MRLGIQRKKLEARYNVRLIEEDPWHIHSGSCTSRFINEVLSPNNNTPLLLNAGSGVYKFEIPGMLSISLDLFTRPLSSHRIAICGNIEMLPFTGSAFGNIICVGEVISYCDPLICISEFARVLSVGGQLIMDFTSSKGPRHWFSRTYGRAADQIVVDYNGTPETIWVYNPEYIFELLDFYNLRIDATHTCHWWSCLAVRLGLPSKAAVLFERQMTRAANGRRHGELVMIAAVKTKP